MSGPYVDIYALCAERSAEAARRFLAAWAPAGTLSTSELAFPAYADQPEILASVDDLFERLERHADASYLVYWETGRDDGIEHVMLAFTEDGAMIAGLSAADWTQPPARVADRLEQLARSVGARWGYVATEEPPARSRAAFLDECHRRAGALRDGSLRR